MAKGKLAPAQQEPRDTYRVRTARRRKPPHTTRAMRQSIIMAMAPPERMPLPPLKWNMQGNMWPSRQNRPAQYSAKAKPMVSLPTTMIGAAISLLKEIAATALSTSHKITTKVRGPPNVR